MENWNISPHKKGNTFNKKKITFPFSIKNCIINIQFKNYNIGSAVIEWTTRNNSLSRQNDNAVIMESRILDVPLGTYSADVNVIFENGNFETYFTANLQII